MTSKCKHAHYLCQLKSKKKSEVYQRIAVINCGPDHACVKDERSLIYNRYDGNFFVFYAMPK